MIMMMLTIITMMIMLIMMMLTVITMMMAVDVLDCFQKHAPPSSESTTITNVKIILIIFFTKVMAVTVLVLGIYMLARRQS